MYVLVGGTGYFGAYMIQAVLENTNENILALGRNVENRNNSDRIKWLKCDVTKEHDIEEAVKCFDAEENKIIYMAASLNIDWVEEHPNEAWKINVTGLELFIEKIKEKKIKSFIYTSTDSVFSGRKEKYTEESLICPTCWYGRQKVSAEYLVWANGYNVLRFPFLIAPSLVSNKNHFYDYIVGELSAGREIEMFSDYIRTAIDFKTASEITIQIVESSKPIPSLLNVSADEPLSKYDIGLRIAKRIGADEKLVVPVTMEQGIENQFSHGRSQTVILDNSKVKEFLGIKEIIISL